MKIHVMGAGIFFGLTMINFLYISCIYYKIWNVFPHFVKKISYLYKMFFVKFFIVMIVLEIGKKYYP